MKRHMMYILILIMLISVTGCKNQSAPMQEVPELLEPVGVEMDTAIAQRGEIYKVSMFNGTIVPYVQDLHFTVDGTLDEIKVLNGDMVEEGQVLATLENEDLLEQIENLETEIENIQTNGEFNDRLAEVDIKMEKEELAELKKRGAYTEAEAKKVNVQMLETKLTQAKELRSLELENKAKELEELRQKNANLEITAPFSGQIVYVMQEQSGEQIENYAPVICLADLNQLTISSEFISDQQIYGADKLEAKILDQTYQVTHVPLDSSEYATKLLAGEEIKTKFSVDAGTEGLVSGQFVSVLVYDAYVEDALTIPINALHRDDKKRYVFKVIDGERIRCEVTVGMTTDTKAEILEGLTEGDVVYVKE